MKLSALFRHPYFVAFSLQTLIAYQWFSGGIGKVQKGQFISTIHTTLSRFENGNPHEWYVSSILQTAKNAPEQFGHLVQWGELLVGAGLISALLLHGFGTQPSLKKAAYIIALSSLMSGAFMNANFYYAAGWMNPSTGGLNGLMFLTQIILVLFWMYSSSAKRA